MIRKGIQHGKVIGLIKELGRIVLSMNLNQLLAQSTENRNRHRNSVHPAGIPSIRKDFPLDQYFSLIHRHGILLKPGIIGHPVEHGADKRATSPGADGVPIGPLPQNGRNGVNHNGFTGPGFAGQRIEARTERNVRLANHCDILNVQQLQHSRYLALLIIPRSSSQNSLA